MSATISSPSSTVWSPFQQAVFAHCQHLGRARFANGNLVVNAGPGSGKTTTMVELVKRLVAQEVKGVLVAAYGTGITAELKQRLAGLPGVDVKSTYGVGYSLVRKLLSARGVQETTIDEGKYRQLARELVAVRAPEWVANGQTELRDGELAAQLVELVDYARVTLTDPRSPAALAKLVTDYGLDAEPVLLPCVAELINAGVALAAREGVIDYTDQVYLPNLWKAELKNVRVFLYAAVIVDECQDLSNAQRGVLALVRWHTGLFVGVGDPNQAIMGFAGADMRSFINTKAAFRATELPLPVCYRSDLNIVREIQAMVPSIQARPNAGTGLVRGIAERQVFGELKGRIGQNVAVLCRTTAELVSLCIELIKDRIPAQVKGRDIGADLSGYLDKIAQLDGYRWAAFREYAEAFRQMQQRKYMRPMDGGWEVIPGKERAHQRVGDYIDALVVCWEAFSCADEAQLKAEIGKLFADEVKGIALMTGHRSKGLEFDTVYILRADRMRLSWPGMTDDQAQQEFCLEFVMKSRARHELIYVTPR